MKPLFEIWTNITFYTPETVLRIFTTCLLVGPTVNREEMLVKMGTYLLYVMSHNITYTIMHRCSMHLRLSEKHNIKVKICNYLWNKSLRL